MTQQELQHLVEELSLSVFNKPFTHRAVFNSRLKTTGGRYHLSDHHLDFNPTMLTEHGMEVFIGIIKHELCHYHLHLAGLGHRHQDPALKHCWQEREACVMHLLPKGQRNIAIDAKIAAARFGGSDGWISKNMFVENVVDVC